MSPLSQMGLSPRRLTSRYCQFWLNHGVCCRSSHTHSQFIETAVFRCGFLDSCMHMHACCSRVLSQPSLVYLSPFLNPFPHIYLTWVNKYLHGFACFEDVHEGIERGTGKLGTTQKVSGNKDTLVIHAARTY